MISVYLLIFITVISWLPHLQKIAFVGFAIFLGAGFYLGQLDYDAIRIAILLCALVFLSGHEDRRIRIVCSAGMVFFTLILFSHKHPGFHNVKIWDAITLSDKSAPATLYFNFDKPLFGVLFLIFYGKQITFQSSKRQFVASITNSLLPLLAIVITIGISIDFIVFDPKIGSEYLIWAANNLLLVCVSEEIFFRGFLQRELCALLSRWKYGEWLAVIAAAILFGIAHFSGGLGYVMLSIIAGFFYGLSFKQTKTIESPILVHFLLNSVHFLFFSYPYYLPSP